MGWLNLVCGAPTHRLERTSAAGHWGAGHASLPRRVQLEAVTPSPFRSPHRRLLSDVPADDASTGVYSHRLGDRWLVGGASNAGCAVLREQGFSGDELARLSEEIDPLAQPPCTDYYPLSSLVVGTHPSLAPHAPARPPWPQRRRPVLGERFPRPDENAVGVLEPVPESRAAFLHCILHGIAKAGGRRGCRLSICRLHVNCTLAVGGDGGLRSSGGAGHFRGYGLRFAQASSFTRRPLFL